MNKVRAATEPADEVEEAVEGSVNERARPVPRISIQAFCEEQRVANVVQSAAEDRRLSKAHVSIHMGGASAAVAHYQESPTPNLIIIESSLAAREMIAELDQLAECCDAGTKVMIIGHRNDVLLYRELLKRGVSEYIVTPISTLQLIEAVSNLYNNPDSDPVGQVLAFIGAKGGVGSSTICHNVSWVLAEQLRSNCVIADLDLAFGTTGLDFDQDPVQGIADALGSPERLDEVLLDRLLTKCSEQLSIFAAPVVLDREYDLSADACDMVLDVVRQSVPYVTVDLPHTWTGWCKRVLMQADQVIITAEPDLANLRNAKNIIDLMKVARKNDAEPRLIINRANMPKRPEISIKEFEQNIGIKAISVIDFDVETFGQASINGRMIEEINPKATSAQNFRSIAHVLANRKEAKQEKKPTAASALAPLFEKLRLKR
ncbi:MAG: AAA family ATPase [Hyphomicrobiaceae bacterium]|nr:AAA family ATPase [Hyphomicrobiaceae bacterium]